MGDGAGRRAGDGGTLLKVWEVVSVEEEDNAYWSSFDSFDDFMCSWLV